MEKYYYTINMVDGEKIKFERQDEQLSQALVDSDHRFSRIAGRIINLNHIVSVEVESDSEREQSKKEQERKNKESLEALKNMKF